MEEQTLANQISELRRETMVIPNGEKKSPVCISLISYQFWKFLSPKKRRFPHVRAIYIVEHSDHL